MSDYSKSTNFTTKDTLPTGNSGKIVKGTELDTEFVAIASAISSKADISSPALLGTPTSTTATTGSNTTQIATTAFVKTAVDTATAALGTMSTQNKTSVDITGGTVVGITDLTVADGGTGASSITANSVILGNGTSALSGNLVAPGTSGNVLKSNGTTWTSAAPATQVFTTSFTSSNQSVPTATATAYTISHTLGVVPKVVRLVAVCTTASSGYAVGDEIELLFSNSTNGNMQAFYYSNASVVGYWSGPYININDASNGSLVNMINNSNFAFKVYAFA